MPPSQARRLQLIELRSKPLSPRHLQMPEPAPVAAGICLTKLDPYVHRVRMWNSGVCKETSLSDGTSQPSSLVGRGRLIFLDLLNLLNRCSHLPKVILRLQSPPPPSDADRRCVADPFRSVGRRYDGRIPGGSISTARGVALRHLTACDCGEPGRHSSARSHP